MQAKDRGQKCLLVSPRSPRAKDVLTAFALSTRISCVCAENGAIEERPPAFKGAFFRKGPDQRLEHFCANAIGRAIEKQNAPAAFKKAHA